MKIIDDKVKLIQEKEIEILIEFSEICRKNNLKYYALGGTLLGAVRHNGFIPWDDDMDLGMPRNDYNKFIEVYYKDLSNNLKLKFKIEDLNNTSIVDTSTEVIFGQKICNPFIDIFPLDGYPDNKIEKIIHSKKILFYRALSKISVVDKLLDRDRGFLENSVFKLSKILKLNKILNTNKINLKLHEIIKLYEFDNSKIVGNILGTYREKELVPKEVIGEGKLRKFNNTNINVPSEDHIYLKNIYGNYMILPKKEKRKGHFVEFFGE
ncbi:LicD family protein [Gemelliphila palaticanis]|uniref:LicD family protein n=1 Tax=Gemelliphila palaticanis TaxID=81950 RepID=A0ABX2SYX8_9BACL|nr:LicD family protein [Gemella palaticanis]MBF0715598.1 LicD family protein [Gemella palaticanis]NYS47528.1 LicD family protein [Gemella palaticanis]